MTFPRLSDRLHHTLGFFHLLLNILDLLRNVHHVGEMWGSTGPSSVLYNVSPRNARRGRPMREIESIRRGSSQFQQIGIGASEGAECLHPELSISNCDCMCLK